MKLPFTLLFLSQLALSPVSASENTGEKFSFFERLYSNGDFISDLQPADVDRHTRALSDVCLMILNSNELVYVY